jgi:L-erythro-3,5-diaminohexanoate dehydrogenase
VVHSALQRGLGVHRVLEPPGVLPQDADRLDADPALAPDEVRLAVRLLELEPAAVARWGAAHDGDGDRSRAALLAAVERRGALPGGADGCDGVLVGVVDEVGPDSPLGLHEGQSVASLVPLALVPLRITDGLTGWDGHGPRVPAAGTAVLFARSVAAVLPDDVPGDAALVVLAVCGAPATTERVVRRAGHRPSVAVLGAAGAAGALSLAAARDARAGSLVAVVADGAEAAALRAAGLADEVVVADVADPLALVDAVGRCVDVTVVCADAAGAEPGAVLTTADGGTVLFLSRAVSLSVAARSAAGLAADVTLLVGSGYAPGHAALALDLYRSSPGVRAVVDGLVRR